MCIAIYADEPITVTLLLEQIHVKSAGAGKLDVTECYDVWMTNRGDDALRKLYVISPQRLLPRDSTDRHVPCGNPANEAFDWPYCKGHAPDQTDREVTARVPMPGEPGMGETVHETTCPRIRIDRFRVHPGVSQDKTWKVLQNWPFTPATLELKDPIEAGQSCYFRLVFSPEEIHHPVPAKKVLLNAPARRTVSTWIQPCVILGPGMLLRNVSDTIRDRTKSETGIEKKVAGTAKKVLVEEGFGHPGKTCRILDHRVSVISDESVVLYDTHSLGAVAFYRVLRGTENRHCHVWLAGSTYFPTEDPYALSAKLHEYFARKESVGGNVAEAAAFAVEADSKNVEQLLPVLADLSILREEGGEYAATHMTEEDFAALERPIRYRAARAGSDGRRFVSRSFWAVCSVVYSS
jgi:hypothetical protein